MNEDNIKIGGSTLVLWYGKLLGKISKYYLARSEKFIDKGKKTIISNPTSEFINPFTILIKFTVDNSNKYQLVLQGEYREKYKSIKEREDDDDSPEMNNQELFNLIRSGHDKWFLKA